MKTEPELCACGRPLHYSRIDNELYVRAMIDLHGPTIPVRVLNSEESYLVPRHYIALHGIKAIELPTLAALYGWEKVRS